MESNCTIRQMEYLGANKLVNKIKPVVSVCVVTYQHADFIKECLESILMQQTAFPFEVIVGEDDSTDGTQGLCKVFAENHPDKVRLFLRSRKDVIHINSQPTGRFNSIENFKAARGLYIALCEGDDYWTDPFKLQKQVDFLECNPNFSGICHQTPTVSEDGTFGRIYGKDLPCELGLEEVISRVSPFHTSSFLFRKKSLPKELPWWFIKIVSADMALFMMVAHSGLIKVIPKKMSVYRKHAAGITETLAVRKNYHKNRIELMLYFKQYLDSKYARRIDEIIEFHQNSISYQSRFRMLMKRVKRYLNLLQ